MFKGMGKVKMASDVTVSENIFSEISFWINFINQGSELITNPHVRWHPIACFDLDG